MCLSLVFLLSFHVHLPPSFLTFVETAFGCLTFDWLHMNSSYIHSFSSRLLPFCATFPQTSLRILQNLYNCQHSLCLFSSITSCSTSFTIAHTPPSLLADHSNWNLLSAIPTSYKPVVSISPPAYNTSSILFLAIHKPLLLNSLLLLSQPHAKASRGLPSYCKLCLQAAGWVVAP